MANTETKGAVVPVTAHNALEAFSKMAAAIPENQGEGMERIAAQILNAQSVQELGDPWDSDNTIKLVGRTIQVTGLKRAPSDFSDGLGVFLIVDYLDPTTNEADVFTTGSMSVVLQLVKAHAEGWLPLDVRVEKSKRPTKDGYFPLHLEILGMSWKSQDGAS